MHSVGMHFEARIEVCNDSCTHVQIKRHSIFSCLSEQLVSATSNFCSWQALPRGLLAPMAVSLESAAVLKPILLSLASAFSTPSFAMSPVNRALSI